MPSTDRTISSAIETVNDTVKKLRLEYRNKGLRENRSGTVRIGLFGNLVGAEVAAEQRIDVGKHDHGVSILHTFAVVCTGFGCTDPLSETTRDLIFECDHGDITEEGRLAVRKQAQAHAETCRALPRTTA
jgi:hypothetical protein